MYRAKMLQVLKELHSDYIGDATGIAYGLWCDVLSRTNTDSTALEVAEEARAVLKDKMKNDPDFKEAGGNWTQYQCIVYSLRYGLADAMILAFEDKYLDCETKRRC